MKKRFIVAILCCLVLALAQCTKTEEKIVEKEVHGSAILSGKGAPTAAQGQIGDYYLDLTTAKLYGAKTAEGWGNPVLDLKGIQGEKGDKGDTGAQGLQGEKGDKGDNGKDGTNGTNGKDGKTPKITISDDGYWVIDGQKSKQKAQGENGTNGTNGKDGAQGPKGDKGDNGKDGVTPTVEIKDGFWVINGKTTDIKAQGERGEKGADGKQGEKGLKGDQGIPGKDGSTIYAGEGFPKSDVGRQGDYYIDTVAKIFYGPKKASGWSAQSGISLTANTITTDDYELSSDGTTLVKWLNPNTKYLDMNSIPALKNVTKIEANAFAVFEIQGTYQLTSIIVGDKVTSIGNAAFDSCKKLKTVELPDGLTTIGNSTFNNCYRLQNIDLPEGITTIGSAAFASCIKLNAMVFPRTLRKIEARAFLYCISLHNVIFQGRDTPEIKPTTFTIEAKGIPTTYIKTIIVPKGLEGTYKAKFPEPYKDKITSL
jgi:hypothetical protein